MAGDDPESGNDFDSLVGLAAASVAVVGLMKAGGSVVNFLRHRNQPRDPGDANRLVSEGQQHYLAGRHQKAVAAWNAALARDPSNPIAANGLASVLSQHATGRLQLAQARNFADLAVGAATDPITRAFCLDTRATIRMRAGEWTHAIVDLEECLRLTGWSIEAPPGQLAVFRLGLAQAALRQFVPARQVLEAAVQMNPDNVEVRGTLAQVYADLSDYDNAIEQHKAAARIVRENREHFPDADLLLSNILNALGCAYFVSGRLVEAEQAQTAGMNACPHNPYPSANCAVAAGRRGDVVAMRALINRSVAAANPADAHYTGALINEATDLDNGDVILDTLLQHGRITPSQYRHHRENWTRRRERMRPRGAGSQINNYHLYGGNMSQSFGDTFHGDTFHGDTFHNENSQIAAQGRYATADRTMQSMAGGTGELAVDLRALAAELAELKRHLVAAATAAGHYRDIAEVESARNAAERDDRASVVTYLAKVGQWVLDVASKVGTPVAEAALRVALGLPA